MKQAIFAWVNQAQIDSSIQPVLSNEGLNFLLKETTGAFEGALTQSWQASTDYESDVGNPTYYATPPLSDRSLTFGFWQMTVF